MKENTPAAKEQPETDQTHLEKKAESKSKTFKVAKEILVDGKNYLPGYTITLDNKKTIDSLKQSKHIK